METNLKKLIPIIGAVCLGMTQIHADYDSNHSNNNNDNSRQTMMVPPSPSPGDSGPNVFISADYTLWAARQSGLAIALSNYYSGGSASPVQGQVFYPNGSSNLQSGFKVDLGVYLPHDNWDLQGEYTWFSNNNNGMQSTGIPSGYAIGTWWIDALGSAQTLYYAAGQFNNWFQRVDATMGRSFFAGHYLALRPFMGLLGAWDSETLNINYRVTSTQTVNNVINNTQTWWGVGPYVGMDSTFTFWSSSSDQWSLFMDLGTAFPWSKFTVNQQTFNAPATNTTLWLQNIFETVAPMIEASLGLRWEMWWSDGAWKFLLQAGWEQQVWFNHNNFIMAGSEAVSAGTGAYTMQGLTIKAVIAF